MARTDHGAPSPSQAEPACWGYIAFVGDAAYQGLQLWRGSILKGAVLHRRNHRHCHFPHPLGGFPDRYRLQSLLRHRTSCPCRNRRCSHRRLAKHPPLLLSYVQATLSGWLSGLQGKNWSREEHQNLPLLGNRVLERDYVQILRAKLRIREEKLKYLSLYFGSSGMRGAFITIF